MEVLAEPAKQALDLGALFGPELQPRVGQPGEHAVGLRWHDSHQVGVLTYRDTPRARRGAP